jgi:hypothetical protein
MEKERYQKRRYEEEKRRAEEEAHRKDQDQYTREQERAHWGCAFFRHCWNEGLKLPTLRNCPEGGKQKAWRKKRKYDSIFSLLLLRLLPLQLFQDHRGGNLEGTGVTMVRGLHQAVPGRFQVVVPVRDI